MLLLSAAAAAAVAAAVAAVMDLTSLNLSSNLLLLLGGVLLLFLLLQRSSSSSSSSSSINPLSYLFKSFQQDPTDALSKLLGGTHLGAPHLWAPYLHRALSRIRSCVSSEDREECKMVLCVRNGVHTPQTLNPKP